MVSGLAPGPIAAPAAATTSPIPMILCNVTTPSSYTAVLSHPYYPVSVTVNNWGNSTDMTTIDNAVANFPSRKAVVLVAEKSGAVAALNWAIRNFEQTQYVRLISPYIDLQERHDRVAGDATAIEDAYGGAGSWVSQMSTWNPGYSHRKEMIALLLNDPDRMIIWRANNDSDTPVTVTDPLARKFQATVHKFLPSGVSEVIPKGQSQSFLHRPAFQRMKDFHAYSRSSPAFAGHKAGDAGKSIVLPDNRVAWFFSDTGIGALDADDTYGSIAVIRNSTIIEENGVLSSQFYSGAPGTPSFIPDQIDFPDHWYWPIGGVMDNDKLYLICILLFPGAGFGETVDTHVLRLNPSTFATELTVAAGEPEIGFSGLISSPFDNYLYLVRDNPTGIGRIPKAQLETTESWEFWNGSVWQSDRLDNEPMRDTQGNILHHSLFGDDFWTMRPYKTGWISAWSGVYSDTVELYYSYLPQGPWTWFGKLPVRDCGQSIVRYGAAVLLYGPNFHPQLDTAPDKLMFGYNAAALGTPVAAGLRDFLFSMLHFRIIQMPNLPI